MIKIIGCHCIEQKLDSCGANFTKCQLFNSSNEIKSFYVEECQTHPNLNQPVEILPLKSIPPVCSCIATFGYCVCEICKQQCYIFNYLTWK